jgi:DNA-3-methyladenine glycosylase II
MPRALDYAALQVGTRELAAIDPLLARVVARLGTPPMFARRPGFATLVKIILEQQVSIVAARTLFLRLDKHVGGMSPHSVAALGVSGLREFGLTRQKSAYCHGLAERILDGRLDLSRVARADEPTARSMLLALPGIGPWTVDIYFLMALRRPDVWPQGDLALASAMQEVLGMPQLPGRDEQRSIAERWAPWRSVAARILWTQYLARSPLKVAARIV